MVIIKNIPFHTVIFMIPLFFSSSTLLTSFDYRDALQSIGSLNTKASNLTLPDYSPQSRVSPAPSLLKKENIIEALQFKIAEQDTAIKKLEALVSDNQLKLTQSQKDELMLYDQNKTYKNLAILGGVTTGLALGFIVFNNRSER